MRECARLAGVSSGEEPATKRFGDDYRETVTLRDGTRAVVRVIQPEDGEKIRQGLAELSPHSRYMRFFSPKDSLSDSELDYLTHVDGINHFALVADRVEKDGGESATGPGAKSGYGVARFVRDRINPEVAEAAIVVADDAAHKGLGNILLGHLAEAAEERGIRWFTCDILAGNTAMCGLLEGLFPTAHFKYTDGGIIEATMPIPRSSAGRPSTPEGDKRENALTYVLKQAGQGLLDIRGRLRRLTVSDRTAARRSMKPPDSSKDD